MMALLQIIGIAERKLAMAKQPTPSRRGIPIAGNYAMEDGKLVGKPSRKTSVSQKIAMKNSKKVRAVRRTAGSQRP